MKNDFDMIVKSISVDKPITIFPVADVHYGAIEHAEREWLAFIDRVKNTPDSYVILAGDLINNNTRSAVGSQFDDVLRPRDQKRFMVDHLSGIRDQILCCVSGNHERRSMKDADDDPTYDIMSKLDLEDIYRQNAAFLKIQLNEEAGRKGRYRNSYTFAVTHGAGGGIYTGATVNRNERWGNAIDGVDCIVAGHTHKGTITRPSKIVIDSKSNTVSVKSYLVISCVSWQNYGSYAMQKMLLPTETSRPIVLKLSATANEKNITTEW